MAKLQEFINFSSIDEFKQFDLTEVKSILSSLSNTQPFDLAHTELLQQQALRGADLISDYLGKIANMLGVAEAKCNTLKNKKALDYKATDGKTTATAKLQAAESDTEVENALIQIAGLKASKIFLEKKYDVLIKTHHFYKDIAAGYKKAIGPQIASYSNDMNDDEPRDKKQGSQAWK